jgi:hypothetical protein
MGYHRDLSYQCKLQIGEAACTIVAYDNGYKGVVGKYSIINWIEKIEDSVNYNSAKSVFQSRHKGKTRYTDRITEVYPTYLHNLWRQVTTLLGDKATFEELARAMNLQSTVEQNLPTLNLTKWTLRRWFVKNKGKEKSHVEKPLLTPEHKQARVLFA